MAVKLRCSECDKTVEGLTQKQAEYMLKIHKLFKHKKADQQ